MITGSYDNGEGNGSDNEEGKFLSEIMNIYEKSLLLKEDTEFNLKQITNLMERVEGVDGKGLGILNEKLRKEIKVIISRVRITINEVKKMDKEYELLRIRVNKFYGKEVLRPFTNTSYLEGMVNKILKEIKEIDNGEGWKNG